MTVVGVVDAYLLVSITGYEHGIAMHQSEGLHLSVARNPAFACAASVGGDVGWLGG